MNTIEGLKYAIREMLNAARIDPLANPLDPAYQDTIGPIPRRPTIKDIHDLLSIFIEMKKLDRLVEHFSLQPRWQCQQQEKLPEFSNIACYPVKSTSKYYFVALELVRYQEHMPLISIRAISLDGAITLCSAINELLIEA